jgi:hypothetical protein
MLRDIWCNQVHDGLAIPFDYYLQAHKKNIDYY